MSALGTLFGPLIATVLAAGDGGSIQETRTITPADADDIFGALALAPMDATSMSAASGGSANYAVDINNIGINNSETNGNVEDVTNINTTSGGISNNTINANQGITTVFNNTGNGVVMQSSVNVNVFLD
ncbi:MAG: hypothetical protein AAF720_14060 [Pseudomonadota bacterium]